MKLIGREEEKAMLLNALNSGRPELIAVYGRRRVGKTFLITQVFKSAIQFEISGLHKGTFKQQMENFHLSLKKHRKNIDAPTSWLVAFAQLEVYLKSLKQGIRRVIFFDEFPWMDTRKSGFLPAFANFWNVYASRNLDLVLVVCGSAAAYMVKKIVRSKGGLHNRITQRLRLLPLSLVGAERLLKHNRVNLSRYDILQIYMVMGGVPYYLNQVKRGEGVAQMIDRLCFKKDGFLRTEFNNVFASLFEFPENHESIIRSLAKVGKGLPRNKILAMSKSSSGGRLSTTLEELEESGFVEKYLPVDKKTGALYRLNDEYCKFYLKFIEGSRPAARGIWSKQYNSPSYKSWSGFSFEGVCLKHVDQIKEALKISGIQSRHGSWIEKGTNNGAQIDLLIDRNDNIVNLCEMKFYATEFKIDKKYYNDLKNKREVYRQSTKTTKNVFLTFITTFGLIQNPYSLEIVENQLTMNDLFKDL